jgi:hypothetical protein
MDTYSQYTRNSHQHKEGESIAQWWFDRGFFLLPVQPNSKRLINRFGPHQRVITTLEESQKWFGGTSVNMAVCGTQTSLILDFDDPGLYRSWSQQFPNESKTYTEQTPRGGYHVFGHCYAGDLQGLELVPGVELKQVCLVAPSVIGDRSYTRGGGEIMDLDAKRCLSPLSKTPIVQPSRIAKQPVTGSLLVKIKATISCLELVGAKVTSGKRFISLPCPFHEDHEPSFWIDQERNLWGCHSCGVRGDVINLFARLKGLTVQESIRELEKCL